jgi:hypothetical protein
LIHKQIANYWDEWMEERYHDYELGEMCKLFKVLKRIKTYLEAEGHEKRDIREIKGDVRELITFELSRSTSGRRFNRGKLIYFLLAEYHRMDHCAVWNNIKSNVESLLRNAVLDRLSNQRYFAKRYLVRLGALSLYYL